MGAYITTESNVEFDKELRPYDLIREIERISAKKRNSQTTSMINRDNIVSQTTYVLIEDLKSSVDVIAAEHKNEMESSINTKRIRIVDILKMRDTNDKTLNGGNGFNYEEKYDEGNFMDTIGKHEKLEISMLVVDNEVVPRFEETVYDQDRNRLNWEEDNDEWEAVEAGKSTSNKKYVVEKKTIFRKFKREETTKTKIMAEESDTETILSGRIGGLRKKEIKEKVTIVSTKEERQQPIIVPSVATKTVVSTVVNNYVPPTESKKIVVRKVIKVEKDTEIPDPNTQKVTTEIFSNIKNEERHVVRPTIEVDSGLEKIGNSRSVRTIVTEKKEVTPQPETASKIISSVRKIIKSPEKINTTSSIVVKSDALPSSNTTTTTTTTTREEVKINPSPISENSTKVIVGETKTKRVIVSAGQTNTNLNSVTYTPTVIKINNEIPSNQTVTTRTVSTKEEVSRPSIIANILIPQKINRVILSNQDKVTTKVVDTPQKKEESSKVVAPTTTTVTTRTVVNNNSAVTVKPAVQEIKTPTVKETKTITYQEIKTPTVVTAPEVKNMINNTKIIVRQRDRSPQEETIDVINVSRSGKTVTTTTSTNVVTPAVERKSIQTININRGDYSSNTSSTNVFGARTVVTPKTNVESSTRIITTNTPKPVESSNKVTTTTRTVVNNNVTVTPRVDTVSNNNITSLPRRETVTNNITITPRREVITTNVIVTPRIETVTTNISPRIETSTDSSSTIYKRQRIENNIEKNTFTTTTIVNSGVTKKKHYEFSRETETQIINPDEVKKSKSGKQAKCITNRNITASINILKDLPKQQNLFVRGGNSASKFIINGKTQTTTVTTITSTTNEEPVLYKIKDPKIKTTMVARNQEPIHEIMISPPPGISLKNSTEVKRTIHSDITLNQTVEPKSSEYENSRIIEEINIIKSPVRRVFENDQVIDEVLKSKNTRRVTESIKISSPERNVIVPEIKNEVITYVEIHKINSPIKDTIRANQVITTNPIENSPIKVQSEQVIETEFSVDSKTTTSIILNDKTITEEHSLIAGNDAITFNTSGNGTSFNQNENAARYTTIRKENKEEDNPSRKSSNERKSANVDRKTFNAQAFLSVVSEMMKQKNKEKDSN